MRLIDADKLIEVLNKKSVPFNANVNDAILTAPTVDAVDKELYEQCKFDKDIAEEQLKNIVRCKDCKEYKYCFFLPNDDDYCSKGEKKTDD